MVWPGLDDDVYEGGFLQCIDVASVDLCRGDRLDDGCSERDQRLSGFDASFVAESLGIISARPPQRRCRVTAASRPCRMR